MDLAIDIQKAYQELDLTPGASLDEVKHSYRRLARALHPDVNPGALGALMRRVNQAYEKLLRHLEGQHPHQAGPARAARHPQADATPKQHRSQRTDFNAYEYEEFQAERGAHGEHARRKAAWQDLKRRFYEQAQKAAQAAARATEKSKTAQTEENSSSARPVAKARPMADEGQVLSPSDPRVAPAKAMDEEPMAGPVSLSHTDEGWRLLGLEKQDGVLLYRVELTGRPDSIGLPVRCCRTCPQCDGAGRYRDSAGCVHRCPSCGGRGRITKADQVKVALPKTWQPGQRVAVPACNSESKIQVQLIPASVE